MKVRHQLAKLDLLLCLALGKEQVQPLRSRVQGMRRVCTSQGQEGLTLGNSQIRVKGSKICPRDFLGIGQGVSRTSHQFRALAKAHKESRAREGKEGTRLVWQCTRVQKRSSLGEYIASRGFTYLRLRKVQSDNKASGTWWNAMESQRSKYK